MAAYWPALYPRFDKVPVRIINEQKAIQDVLAGETNTTKELAALKLFDKAGKIDVHCPLVDAIRIFLATEQAKRQKKDHRRRRARPSVRNRLRLGCQRRSRRRGRARARGAVKIIVGQKEYSNPSDRDLIDALRVGNKFNKAELVLEETEVDPDVLTETRKFVMKLAKKRSIDETPAAIGEAAESLAIAILAKASAAQLWAGGSDLPLPAAFTDGADAWQANPRAD